MAIIRQSSSRAATPPCLGTGRVLLLALAALLVGLAALAMRPGPAGALTVGFMDPAMQGNQPDAFWADMLALNGETVRYDVYWRDIAPNRPADPRNPNDPAYDWTVVDGLVRDASAHGAEVLLTLWRTPSWARADGGKSPGNFYSYAPNLQDWGAFVYAAATRYSGQWDPDADGALTPLPLVTKWEMWNEPNYIGALRPQRKGGKVVSPAIYTQILNRGYREIQTVERERRLKLDVLGGAMNRGFGGVGSIPPLKFLRGMKTARAKFDLASFHPYPTSGRKGFNDGAKAPNISLANFKDYEKELDRLWPAKRYRIWITEYGLQSKPDRYGATPQGQAKFIKTALTRLVTKHPRVTHLIWFLITDEAVEAPGKSDTWQSGLRNQDGTPKPAYQAWINAAVALL